LRIRFERMGRPSAVCPIAAPQQVRWQGWVPSSLAGTLLETTKLVELWWNMTKKNSGFLRFVLRKPAPGPRGALLEKTGKLVEAFR